MKVSELIERLRSLPPDHEVMVEAPCCCGDYRPATEAVVAPVLEMREQEWRPSGAEVVRISGAANGREVIGPTKE